MCSDSFRTVAFKTNSRFRAHTFEGRGFLALKRLCTGQTLKKTLFCVSAGAFQERAGGLPVLTAGTTRVLSIFSTETNLRGFEFLGTLKG